MSLTSALARETDADLGLHRAEGRRSDPLRLGPDRLATFRRNWLIPARDWPPTFSGAGSTGRARAQREELRFEARAVALGPAR